jgi:predicted nucleotidyltransferase
MRDINTALKEHFEYVKERANLDENQYIGIFLYGSQNYGVATENSDIDTKLIYVPTLEQLLNNSDKTKTYELENGEHCELMSISHLVKNFRKQNINFLEILYTPYHLLYANYADIYKDYFVAQRELISHYDIKQAVRSISGQAIHTLTQNPLDGKKVGNGYRLFNFLTQYIKGDNYIYCLTPNKTIRDHVITLKQTTTLPDSSMTDSLIKSFKQLDELVKTNDFNIFEANKEFVDNKMMAGMKKMVRILDEKIR